MTLEVRPAAEAELDRWDDTVERSEHATAFHRLAALRLQAYHAGAEFHPLIGLKGDEVVGLFPVFELHKGPFSGAFSPPPYLWVPYGGPVLVTPAGMKRRKVDRQNREFVTGCLDWLDDHGLASYYQFKMPPGYEDLRPFDRNHTSLRPSYTYTVDLDRDRETVLASFSRDARTNIDAVEASDYTVSVGDGADIDWILDRLQDRYSAQGITFPDISAFVRELHQQLPNGTVRPYVCARGSERLGGLIVIGSGATTYRWLGGMKPDDDADIAVNDALDWAVMCDAMDRGMATYDMVGAGVQSINRYKSKFNPSLSEFYVVRGGSWGLKRLVGLYRAVDDAGASAGVW